MTICIETIMNIYNFQFIYIDLNHEPFPPIYHMIIIQTLSR